MKIRKVTLEDAEQIVEIYNYYIKNTHHTFETAPLSADVMEKRIRKVNDDYPYLVAKDGGIICGYAYASQFKLRQAYDFASEVSIYVKNDAKKRGIGTMLYERLFDELEDTDIHSIVAGIALPNDGSVRFHEKLGFKKVAHFSEIGYKLGRWIDVGYWEMMNRI